MMRPVINRTLATAFICLFPMSACLAQHLDVLVQVVEGKVVTGGADYDNNTWLVGQNVFPRQLLSNFRGNDPGFTTLETGNPLLQPGVSGLAPQSNLFFDIVPSTIVTQRANVWYWDGADLNQDGFTLDDVDFGLPPDNVTWNIFDDDFQLHTADGSDTIVQDVLVQTAFSDGAVHSHLLMQVDDGDGDLGTPPPEGIYLTSMVFQADGFEESDPFFFVHRTAELTNSPRDVAADWVNLNYDNLIRLPGDYDRDGLVDDADYGLWRDTFGSIADPAGAGADGNLNGLVDAADFTIWRDHRSDQTVVIPEPSSILLLAVIACFPLVCIRRQ